jgi:hypothetical protein
MNRFAAGRRWRSRVFSRLIYSSFAASSTKPNLVLRAVQNSGGVFCEHAVLSVTGVDTGDLRRGRLGAVSVEDSGPAPADTTASWGTKSVGALWDTYKAATRPQSDLENNDS